MTDLHAILQAFPAGTKLLVIAAELPNGAEQLHVLPSAAERGVSDLALEPRASHAPADPIAPGSLRDDVGSAPLTHLQRLRSARGNIALKPREWAAFTGLSARELRRAIDIDAVPHADKEDGRDHGAKLITADAMLQYLSTVYAVERGQMQPPAWWPEVRGRRA